MTKVQELTAKRNTAWAKADAAYKLFQNSQKPADRKAWIEADENLGTYAELLELAQRQEKGQTGTQQCEAGIHAFVDQDPYTRVCYCVRYGKMDPKFGFKVQYEETIDDPADREGGK